MRRDYLIPFLASVAAGTESSITQEVLDEAIRRHGIQFDERYVWD